jgi:YVTN family beta-propeller protein
MNKLKTLILLAIFMAGLSVQAQTDDPLYALPSANSPTQNSSTIALSSNGRRVAMANMLNNTVSIVNLSTNEVLAEIPVGDDPRTVDFAVDDSLLLTVNRGDGTLSVIDVEAQSVIATYPVGVLPYGVIDRDDQTAFVALQGTDEVIEIDFTTGEILARMSTPDSPMGLALWGDFLYVSHLWSGELSLIYLPQMRVVRTIQTGIDSSLSPSVVVDPRDGLLYLPQSRSNAQNENLTFDTTIFPVVNVVDLENLGVQRLDRLTVDTADRPVNMPFDLAVDTVRDWVFVVNAGSNNISILNRATGFAEANIRVGSNPRGIRLSLDNNFAYIHNAIEGSLTIINTRTLSIVDVLPISDLRIPVDELIGAELFHTAADPRIAANWISCASCHFDGQSDGRVWLDFPGGARNTPALFDLQETAPYNWSATWDELADVELKIRELQVGRGLLNGTSNTALGNPHTELSLDLDILAGYLLTFTPPATPESSDVELVARGAEVFASLDCAFCHAGTSTVDGLSHDVGTGGEFNTPTLHWLWLSQPYFHDGRAETLWDVFVLPGEHQLVADVPLEDIDALVAYLMSISLP